ncbi:MAG: hypothetical protein EAZ95_20620 [Bacteroidetes bacterium]|nr:MAG: hypothetical protein EAZ95_20620 [Bacteroidota bacterium]
MDWKDRWEEHASQEAENFSRFTEEYLLAQIEQGYYGSYYNIWYAIADKKNPLRAVPVLLKVLQKIEMHREIYYDQLHAIHCATAVCQLLGIDEKERQELIYGNRLQNLPTFEQHYERLKQKTT